MTKLELRNVLTHLAIPIGDFISKLQRPPCQMTGSHFEKALYKIENGDILFSKTDYELSNIVLPGTWKHCAVYDNGYVYEATTKNTRRIRFDEWFYKKDHVGIARLSNQSVIKSEESLLEGIQFLEYNLGEPYDFSFTFKGEEKWYCSKYVYDYLLIAYPNFNKYFFVKSDIFGEPLLTPDDLFFSNQFTIVEKFR